MILEYIIIVEYVESWLKYIEKEDKNQTNKRPANRAMHA